MLGFDIESYGIENPSILYLLASILILLILYLLKPKPKKVKFSTLMFFQSIEKEKRLASLLNRIIRDPLLLTQSLILFFLIAAMADPFILVKGSNMISGDIAIVIDSSASMKTFEAKASRFDIAKAKALAEISRLSENSRAFIIAAEAQPTQISGYLTKEEAIETIKRLKPSDATSNLEDAILYSLDLLKRFSKNKEKRVYVISDFASFSKDKLALIRKIAEDYGIKIFAIPIGSFRENVGIVSCFLYRHENHISAKFKVKNFCNHAKKVTLAIFLDNEKIKEIEEKLEANSEKFFSIKKRVDEKAHVMRIEILEKDSMLVDNDVIIYIPEKKKMKVLLITKDDEDFYLKYAFQSLDFVDLKLESFPLASDFNSYDVVVLATINDKYLPGTFLELEKYLLAGGNVIFIGTYELALEAKRNENLQRIIPVKIDIETPTRRVYNYELDLVDHEIFRDVNFDNIIVSKMLDTREKNDSITLVSLLANEKKFPLISYKEFGAEKGIGLYFGISPKKNWSNLQFSIYFPVIINNILSWFLERKGILEMRNFKTGERISIEESYVVKTPQNEVVKNPGSLLLDTEGLYEIIDPKNRTYRIAVNLLSEEESDIQPKFQEIGDVLNMETPQEELGISRKELWKYFAGLVIIIMFVEIYLYRLRGKI